MNQLWAWEYEGQDEVGTQKPDNSCVFKSAASEAIPILRHPDHITNLRKVKVVDEDCQDESHTFVNDICKYCGQKLFITEPKNFGAIVEEETIFLSKKYLRENVLNAEFPSAVFGDGYWCAVRKIFQVKEYTDFYSLIGIKESKSEQVTEPKNFGAIVEAYFRSSKINKGAECYNRFFFNGRDWILEGTLYNFAWSDLINPIIISEGVE